MKYLSLAIVLLVSASLHAQGGTQSVSFSLKDKFNQIISDSFSKSNTEIIKENQLTLNPNPVTSHLHINSTGHIKKIVLVNAEGKVVRRVRLRDAKSYTLDTSLLMKGDYKVVISHYNQGKAELLRNI